MSIQDSGNRREFETGAVRDIAEGKGRCDLLPLDVIYELTGDSVFIHIDDFVRKGNKQALKNAILVFSDKYPDKNIFTHILEVSKHYEDGCTKYGERNWEQGIPLNCYIDSGVRHYIKFRRGDTDERHDRAFIWNMLGALWTLRHLPEMNDLPFAVNADKGLDISF